MVNLSSKFLTDLNQPMAWEDKGWFKKGKLRVVIINEDMSGSIYFRHFPKTYVFEVAKQHYFFVSKTVLNLDFPTVLYFYKNPKPIFLTFERSDLRTKTLYSPEQFAMLDEKEQLIVETTTLDAETVKLYGDTLYARGLRPAGFWTLRNILIIAGALLFVVLIILQVTCTADFMNLKMCDKKAFVPLIPFLFKKWGVKR